MALFIANWSSCDSKLAESRECVSLVLMESPRSFLKPMLWLDYSFTLFICEEQNNWIQNPCSSLFFSPVLTGYLLNWTSCLIPTGYTNYPSFPHSYLLSRHISCFSTLPWPLDWWLCFASVGTPASWLLAEFSQWEVIVGDQRARGQRKVTVTFSPIPPAQCSISDSCVLSQFYNTYTSPFLQDFGSLNSANSTFSPHSFSPKGMDISPLLLISQCLIFFICIYNPLCK